MWENTRALHRLRRQLAISQPAVSQAVKNLEQESGQCPLFVRTSKGVRLTVEGKLLYSYVQRGYEYDSVGRAEVSGDAGSGPRERSGSGPAI